MLGPFCNRLSKCSDLRSFGVVLWELLTHEIPYKDVDSSAIIWGVGSNCLHLPIPSSTPDGIKLLMTQCWLVTLLRDSVYIVEIVFVFTVVIWRLSPSA